MLPLGYIERRRMTPHYSVFKPLLQFVKYRPLDKPSVSSSSQSEIWAVTEPYDSHMDQTTTPPSPTPPIMGYQLPLPPLLPNDNAITPFPLLLSPICTHPDSPTPLHLNDTYIQNTDLTFIQATANLYE